jgi:hypothetical protein
MVDQRIIKALGVVERPNIAIFCIVDGKIIASYRWEEDVELLFSVRADFVNSGCSTFNRTLLGAAGVCIAVRKSTFSATVISGV